MEVVSIKENKDGSADLVVDLTHEEVQLLLSNAILRILKKAAKKIKKK